MVLVLKFNDLGMGLGMALKFDINVATELNLKFRTFLKLRA